MKITVIGWYGTETIGDRAILSGILTVLSNIFGDIQVKLGSLFPFFSERTVFEDYEIWEKLIGRKIEIDVFDSKVPKELNRALRNSDILVMGGGPLMHIQELHMIDYAFKKAKKLGNKTIIFGCGIGPIFKKKYLRALFSILNNSDISYLRDSTSVEILRNLKNGASLLKNKKIFVSHDPAVIPCLYSRDNYTHKQDEYIALNLRKFPASYSQLRLNPDEILISFINKISQDDTAKIKLIPMHYFSAGGDDREYFYQLLNNIENRSNIYVQDVPLNLEETLKVFADADINIGMRYHSVLFQTVMNGNNYIIDYTEPEKGKIAGFIKTIDKSNFYKDRYINLQQEQIIDFKFSKDKFDIELNLNELIKNSYIELNQL